MKNSLMYKRFIFIGLFFAGFIGAENNALPVNMEYVEESECKPGTGLLYDTLVIPAALIGTASSAILGCSIAYVTAVEARSCPESVIGLGIAGLCGLVAYSCGKGVVAAFKKMHSLYFPKDAWMNESDVEFTRLKYGMAASVHAVRMMSDYRDATQVHSLFGILFAYNTYMTLKLGHKVAVYRVKPDEKNSEVQAIENSSLAL